ncbi:MAG: hypothetical protein ACI4K7_04710 [Oscillospiraceae bacterium]
MPYVSIHRLRHTNASIMISSVVPITTTAKRLGHSTSATTIGIKMLRRCFLWARRSCIT